jgi:hypothetical protein
MANITAIVGLSGAAKTLLMSNIAWREYLKGRRIFANYYLQLDLEDHTFKDRQKKKDLNLNFMPLFEPDDLKRIPRTASARIFIDEIDAFGADNILESGVDSYTYRSKEATATEKYFKKRLRKSNANAYYTVQQMAMVPIRIREETTAIFQPKVKKWIETGNKEHPTAPQILHYSIFKRDLNSGKFRNTGQVRNLMHPLGLAPHITPDMLSIYDTNADIFFKEDKNGITEVTESELDNPVSGNKNPYSFDLEKQFFSECEKIFNHGSIVELLKNSGRHSKWKGDIMITPPGKPPIVFDICGPKRHNKNGNASQLHAADKQKVFSDMSVVDTTIGSHHFLAYYDKEFTGSGKEKKSWCVVPVEDNLFYLTSRTKKFLNINDLKNISPLSDLTLSELC